MNKKTVKDGTWRNLEFAIAKAEEAMRKEGWTTLPGQNALEIKGYGNLASAVSKYHGGFLAFRDILGQENRVGRWKDLNYTIQQVRQAMQKEGWTTLPSSQVLNGKGYSSLNVAIAKYHGGFHAFRELIGQTSERAPSGLWPQQEYAIQQARQAMQKEGWTTLPSQYVLADKGYGGLSTAITKYHGGFPAFRKTLGQENLLGRWKDCNYTIQQVRQAMQKEGWTRLPSGNVLVKQGYSSLKNAIINYHGGFAMFRELLAKAQSQPTHKEHLENLLHNYLDRPDQDDNAAGCRVPA